MHILFLTTYFEPDSGAAAVRLSRLAHLLKARGHDITVLTTLPHYPVGQIQANYRGKFAIVEDRDGLRVIRTWLLATQSPRISRRLISQNTFMLTALLRGLGIKRPNVMLVEAQPIFTGFAGALLGKIKRVPVVLNVSDLWPDHLLSVGAMTEDQTAYRIARRLVDAMYRAAGTITALSPIWAEKIAGYIGGEEKIHVIYNGVDLERFHPGVDSTAFKQKYGLTAPNIASFIGTFATQYDFDAMTEVARRFAAREDTQFVFIGGGTLADKVAAINLPNVTQIVWINHDEIPQAWAASTLSYWVMRDEALYHGTIPAKLYEALACGVPIAAAMEGAGASMIRDSGGGVVVSCGDVDGLVDTMSRLLDDAALREQHGQAGRTYAETHFDPESVADRYEAVLTRLVRD